MTTTTWQNWSGNVHCTPADLARPTSTDEVGALVAAARDRGTTVRPVGAGHSFTPLVATDGGIVLSLDDDQGLVAVDHDAMTATVRAGTRLGRLGELLASHGMAMENLGDIDEQSIAGAIGTGTHGTGATLGGIASQVVGLELVDGTGSVRRVDERDPDLLDATRVGLGAMGVVTEVTLRTLPAYRLAYEACRQDVDDLLADLDDLVASHRHVEFFWMPHGRWAQRKVADVSDEPVTGASRWTDFNRNVLENGALQGLSRLVRARPSTARTVGRLMGLGIGRVRFVAPSHRVFATPRHVKFQELEYAIPRERFHAAFADVREVVATAGREVHFPIECRFAAADTPWLSTSHGRDTAYLAVHVYEGMPHLDYFRAVEEVLRAHEGRPHWGKIHGRRGDDLARQYPRMADWRATRADLDPDEVLLTPYLRDLLGTGRTAEGR